MPNFPRTDLAVEAEAIHRSAAAVTELPGVRAEETNRRGFSVTEVHVLDAAGENALCKPIGDYYTLALDPLLRREDDAFGVGQPRQVTTHLLGDLVAHDEVEVVVAPLVETFTLRTRAEQDEPEDLVARGGDRCFVGEIERDDMHSASALAARRHTFELAAPTCREDQRRAFPRERVGEGLADAGRCARDPHRCVREGSAHRVRVGEASAPSHES